MKPKTGSRKKEQYRTKDGMFTPKLTRKQKAFADHLLDNPKHSATEAAQQSYLVSDRNTAKSIAAENLTKPAIQLYMNQHIDKAKETVVNLLDSEKDEIKLRASQDILDRSHGKATQRTEVKQQSVNINLTFDNAEYNT
jgi:phage terminase small subunit